MNGVKTGVRTGAGLAVTLFVLLVMCLSASGCSQADDPLREGLPAWTDETSMVAQAHEAIEIFNARDYESLAARYKDNNVTADKIEEDMSALQDEYGAFKAYGDAVFLQGESLGRPYATIIQEAVYEKGKGEFRISFFKDGTLAGFYFLKAA